MSGDFCVTIILFCLVVFFMFINGNLLGLSFHIIVSPHQWGWISFHIAHLFLSFMYFTNKAHWRLHQMTIPLCTTVKPQRPWPHFIVSVVSSAWDLCLFYTRIWLSWNGAHHSVSLDVTGKNGVLSGGMQRFVGFVWSEKWSRLDVSQTLNVNLLFNVPKYEHFTTG